ncbi:MAG: nucleotidyltransferase domain-containing protein [Nanoarchaeota archaeon]
MVQNKNSLELEIILVLLKNKSHLREIARTLNESHSTVLRKINVLVKENVLDYKNEGKNKVFFIKDNLKVKNYVYSAEIYKLNKLLKKHPELSIIFEEIKKNFSKGMIILFGSYAKGIPKKDSDIDIYLETNDTKIKDKVKETNSKLSIKIGKFDIKSLLIKEIIKNHIIIRGLEDFYERIEFSKEA